MIQLLHDSWHSKGCLTKIPNKEKILTGADFDGHMWIINNGMPNRVKNVNDEGHAILEVVWAYDVGITYLTSPRLTLLYIFLANTCFTKRELQLVTYSNNLFSNTFKSMELN